tara:strand:+ start:224 stop:343 length:120 start_codon:yes stop_codon:yes gene_type:complete
MHAGGWHGNPEPILAGMGCNTLRKRRKHSAFLAARTAPS